MRISDWSSDVCSSDLPLPTVAEQEHVGHRRIALRQPRCQGVARQRAGLLALLAVLVEADQLVFEVAVRDLPVHGGFLRGGQGAFGATWVSALQCSPYSRPSGLPCTERKARRRARTVSPRGWPASRARSEEHKTELQSRMRTKYAVVSLE